MSATATRDYEQPIDAAGEYVTQRTYGTGRVCAHDGCTTVLSKYHEGEFCYAHADDAFDPRTLAMAYTKEGNRACATCRRLYAPNLRNFYSDPKSKDGLSAECVACLNPDRHRRERATQKRARCRYEARKRNTKEAAL